MIFSATIFASVIKLLGLTTTIRKYNSRYYWFDNFDIQNKKISIMELL